MLHSNTMARIESASGRDFRAKPRYTVVGSTRQRTGLEHIKFPTSQAPRYNPYSRSSTPQREHSLAAQPRLLPSYTQAQSQQHGPHPSQTHSQSAPKSSRAKAYETTRPINLYQPSRGAQRDAKWHARYAERTHLVQPQQHHQASHLHQGPEQRRTHQQYALPDLDKIRREQQAAIAAARQTHALHVQRNLAAGVKDQEERKTKRIQLQVFVHARPTFCVWDECQAVLNSWALLEKHILHAHLRSRVVEKGEHDLVACKWEGCGKEFLETETCYKHCLIGHMSGYSARCPFNCLYEGPNFPELMAHLSRRHPKSTPDDFVPGLIHHQPEHLPPASTLPPLPQYAKIEPYHNPGRSPLPDIGIVTPLITPYQSGVTGGNLKVRRLIARLCVSGKRPRKEHFGDKMGASAAIGAILENSKRVVLANQKLELEKADDDDVVPPMSAGILSAKSTMAVDLGVKLVDIRKKAREAKKSALALEETMETMDGCGTDSVGGSRPTSRSGAEDVVRPKLLVRIATGMISKQKIRQKESDDGGSGDSGESTDSEQSRFSEYKVARRIEEEGFSPGGEGELKRSERLKKKLIGSESGTPVQSPSKIEFWR